MENTKTILLIDEARDDRRLLAIRLEGLGFKVFEAETPAQVRGVLGREKPDLAVAEWSLPGWPGESPARMLAPLQIPLFIFTDQPAPDALSFPESARVEAVVPKAKRSELLQRLLQREASDPHAVLKSFLSGRHILLVEGSATVRHFMKRAIETEEPGWSVLEAGNGLQALTEMGRRPLDLVVIDMEMPEMDGPAVLRLMREKPQLRFKPVLALTACGRRDLREAFKDDPHVAFLPKPVTAGQIVAAVQNSLSEKRQAAAVV